MSNDFMNVNLDMPTCECELCGKLTNMTGTKRCDPCWELETRIEYNPQLAKKILARLEENVKNKT